MIKSKPIKYHIDDIYYTQGILMKEFTNLMKNMFKDECGVDKFKTLYINTQAPSESEKKRLPGGLLIRSCPILAINPIKEIGFVNGVLQSSSMVGDMSSIYDVDKYTTNVMQIEGQDKENSEITRQFDINVTYKTIKYIIDVVVIDDSRAKVENLSNREISIHELNAKYTHDVELEWIIPNNLLEEIFIVHGVLDGTYVEKLKTLNKISKSPIEYKMNTGTGKHVYVVNYMARMLYLAQGDPEISTAGERSNLVTKFAYKRTFELEINLPNLLYLFEVSKSFILPKHRDREVLVESTVDDSFTIDTIGKGNVNDVTLNVINDNFSSIVNAGWRMTTEEDINIDMSSLYSPVLNEFESYMLDKGKTYDDFIIYTLSSPDIKVIKDDIEFDYVNKCITNPKMDMGCVYKIQVYINSSEYKQFVDESLAASEGILKSDDIYGTLK